jgi:hypothetical protein
MSIKIISGATSDELTVDTTSKAARVTLYGANSASSVTPIDRSVIVPGGSGGMLLMGSDYKTGRLIRTSPAGTLRTSNESLFLYDSVEGAAVNTNLWIQTTTTQTITQATGAITFNAGSSTATTTGAMHVSHRFVPFIHRNGLIFRSRVRATAHSNNNQLQFGFGAPGSVTAVAVPNGAFWRKDSTGQWVPVISTNSAEQLGTPISNATFTASVATTDYAIFEVFLEETRATFTIQTSLGAIVNQQTVDFPATNTSFASTHLNVFHQCVNTGATGAAVQMLVSGTSVLSSDVTVQRDWTTALSGMSYNSLTSPTAYTQLANYTNNTAPTARTLSNTAAAETTLGGLVRANSIAGGATDLILFGFQVPSPYTFYFTGIRIPAPLNEVVAVATTATIFTYGLAFNSSAVSLATAGTYPPMRMALGGVHSGAVALAANAQFSGNDVVYTPTVPIAVQPGRFFHVITRELVGTATATETYQWNILVDGYFE